MDKYEAGRRWEHRHQVESPKIEAAFARLAPGHPDPMPTIPREPAPR